MTTPSFFGYLLSPKIIAETTWEVIGNFERKIVSDPASIVNFLFSPAIDFDKISMLALTFDGSFTIASTDILLGLNNIGSNYNTYGRRIIGGVETLVNLVNQNGFRIATSNLLSGADDIINAITWIQLNKAGTNKEAGFQSVANGVSINGNEVFSGALNFVAGVFDVDRVTVQLTSGGWNVGTRITLYQVKR